MSLITGFPRMDGGEITNLVYILKTSHSLPRHHLSDTSNGREARVATQRGYLMVTLENTHPATKVGERRGWRVTS